jgi:hypothetical protein
MVIANRNSLARIVTQMAAVNLMPDQQHDSLASLAQNALLDEEGVEVIWRKGLLLNVATVPPASTQRLFAVLDRCRPITSSIGNE